MTHVSLNVGIGYLAGAALALAALYLAERRWGARRIIPGALATLAAIILWVGIDAPARADVTPCASTRNGWTYDHCAGVVTPGPDAWVKPGSDAPFVVTLWRRDTHGGPQTRAARISVADLSGFPADLGVPGEDWCGLQWDVTREGVWLAGVQTQWTCPTPSPTATTTPTTTETSWTSPSTTSETSSPTSSAPTPTTGNSSTSSLPTETQSSPPPSGPTTSRPTTNASAPTTHGGPRTTSHHATSDASTTPALPDTGEDWISLVSALGVGSILLGAWLVWVRRGGRGRHQ